MGVSSANVPIGGELDLTDHFGNSVTIQTFRGRFVLLFFGFTHCRVVCPTVLGTLSRALERLGSQADLVQPLYITVDPERDTPAVMKAFLEKSFPRFLGLSGSKDQIARAKADFKVFAQKQLDDTAPGGYVVPHTAFSYLLDPQGNYSQHFTNASSEDDIVDELAARAIIRQY